jgi:NAD(P)-dependent dehydrogenase (short-subunit alcohol dehydrogenase family)
VIVDARDDEALTKATRDLKEGVTAISGDVTDPAHRADLVDKARELGGLDLLINNASMLGASPQPHLDVYPVETLRDVYEVNVFAPLALTQLALPHLRERDGMVINVTSDAASEPYAGWGGYGSSKAALNQVSTILAEEEPGLFVYQFDPGDMNTQMHQEAFPGEDISDRPLPEQSVPALLALIEGRPPSAAYRVDDMVLVR